MENVVIASNEADARAAEAVEQHHAQMAGTLEARVEALVSAASRGEELAGAAREELVEWCERELVPHALAEEGTMYPAARARAEGRLLVDGMLEEHKVITGLVREVADSADPVRAAAAAKALAVMFQSHLAKENDLVLPLLVAAPDVSVADLLGGMHELLGGEAQHDHGDHGPGGHDDGHEGHGHEGHAHGAQPVDAPQAAAEDHHCNCGEEKDADGYPELDARAVPHAIRHATIFGALDAVKPGGGMVLVAPHDPKPLLAQVEQRAPGAFDVKYLEQGPEAWRLAFVRS